MTGVSYSMLFWLSYKNHNSDSPQKERRQGRYVSTGLPAGDLRLTLQVSGPTSWWWQKPKRLISFKPPTDEKLIMLPFLRAFPCISIFLYAFINVFTNLKVYKILYIHIYI